MSYVVQMLNGMMQSASSFSHQCFLVLIYQFIYNRPSRVQHGFRPYRVRLRWRSDNAHAQWLIVTFRYMLSCIFASDLQKDTSIQSECHSEVTLLNKKTQFDPGKYRPIALLRCVCVLEKICIAAIAPKLINQDQKPFLLWRSIRHLTDMDDSFTGRMQESYATFQSC